MSGLHCASEIYNSLGSNAIVYMSAPVYCRSSSTVLFKAEPDSEQIARTPRRPGEGHTDERGEHLAITYSMTDQRSTLLSLFVARAWLNVCLVPNGLNPLNLIMSPRLHWAFGSVLNATSIEVL